jgi:cell division protein ZapA
MAEVNLAIAGRSYALHCRDGDEARLHQLSRMIGDRVDKVKASSPGLTEVRQLLFAALLLADELSDAQLASQHASRTPEDDTVAAQTLETLAERLEAIGEALAADPATA